MIEGRESEQYMDRKNIPLILMLTAGAITCVITFIQQYDVLTEMTLLLVVLVVFYGLGSILKWTLDYFERQNEEKLQEEGEVIEKEADGTVHAQENGETAEEKAGQA